MKKLFQVLLDLKSYFLGEFWALLKVSQIPQVERSFAVEKCIGDLCNLAGKYS